MSEDCLYLNVFTPSGVGARKGGGKIFGGREGLPVMIWLHGGAFQQGGGNRDEYRGDGLADKDVIVVTVNYRLGALGWMVSIEDGLYGNYGLMDQRAALDWVHNNIKNFGGDPNKVTLFGESAGAVMIGLHAMMEGAGVLFQKIIMQSNPMGYSFRSVIVADFIGKALKREVDCRDLECLRSERVEEILDAQGKFMGVPRSVGDFFVWSPTETREIRYAVRFKGEEGSGGGGRTKSDPSSSDGKVGQDGIGTEGMGEDGHERDKNNRERRLITQQEGHRVYKFDYSNRRQKLIDAGLVVGETGSAGGRRKKKSGEEGGHLESSMRWANVNVSQPLDNLNLIPYDIPVIIGTNAHEGQIFVYSAFPAPMPKVVYWMFVGALFRENAGRVLNHYRDVVRGIEERARVVGEGRLREEEARQEVRSKRGEESDEIAKPYLVSKTKQARISMQDTPPP